MKRVVIVTLMIFSLIVLGACTGNKKEALKESGETATMSENEQSTEQKPTNESKEQSQSVFTAVLVEDAKKNDTVEQSTRLVLDNVTAIEDSGEIINMMKNDGVILNVSDEQFAKDISTENLKTGDKIQFTLVGLPAMTMSIPPQVVGNSVIKVEKI